MPPSNDIVAEGRRTGNDMRSPRRPIPIPVLAYHRIAMAPAGAKHPDTYVSPRAFARQLALLKTLGYQTIRPESYALLRRGIACQIPFKPILITFDDGSSTVFSQALPLLKSHGFYGVVFVVSSQLGKPAIWDGETEDSGNRQLNAEELKILRDEGWAIGSHTVTHTHLSTLDPQELAKELLDSKKDLESVVGQEVAWFAYPYGDFNPVLRETVARAGYRLAFATEEGDGHALSIPRRIISGRAGFFKFLWRLSQARRLSRR